jgi:YggT family protein
MPPLKAATTTLRGDGLAMETFVWLIRIALDVLFVLLLARCVISWVRPTHYHPIVRWIEDVTDPLLRPVQRILPPWKTWGIDFSPLIVFLLANILARFLIGLLRGAG